MDPTHIFLSLFLTTMLQVLKSHMIATVTWLVALGWTLVVGGSLVWNVRNDERETMDTAYAEARANLNKDITLRRWATDHGGVYVPITARQQSVPWLNHVPGRDVTTTDGRQLTLLNPATAVRQMMDRYAQDYGVRGRITGLKYLNPSNAPDAWKRHNWRRLPAVKREKCGRFLTSMGNPTCAIFAPCSWSRVVKNATPFLATSWVICVVPRDLTFRWLRTIKR